MERDRVKIDMPKWTWEAIKQLIADAEEHFPKMAHDPNYTRLAITTDLIKKRAHQDIQVKEYWSRRKDQ